MQPMRPRRASASSNYPSSSSAGSDDPQHLPLKPPQPPPTATPLPKLPAVPWGLARVFQIMALWLTSFYAVGTLAFPMLLEACGISQASLSPTGQALLYLLIDAAQLVSSFLILNWCTKQHAGVTLRSLLPFRPATLPTWLPAALLSCLTFPAIDYVAHRSTAFFPLDASLWSTSIEQSAYTGEWGANAAYITTTLVCAPIWEEAIFRGFLLASLANLMPTAHAVLFSSTLFALFHFKLTSFLPLFLLGLVFALNYMHSGDMGAPVLLHALWNLYLWLSMALRGVL